MVPKSLGVATIPRPKCPCQSRLTITRAVRGWSGRTSHSARARRRPLERGLGVTVGLEADSVAQRTGGNAGATSGPFDP